jgi:hypothetical protein
MFRSSDVHIVQNKEEFWLINRVLYPPILLQHNGDISLKDFGVILNVLVCDIWIIVLIQTSALVGQLYTAN